MLRNLAVILLRNNIHVKTVKQAAYVVILFVSIMLSMYYMIIQDMSSVGIFSTGKTNNTTGDTVKSYAVLVSNAVPKTIYDVVESVIYSTMVSVMQAHLLYKPISIIIVLIYKSIISKATNTDKIILGMRKSLMYVMAKKIIKIF